MFSDNITDAGDKRTNTRAAVIMITLGLTAYLMLGTITFHILERPPYLNKCRSMRKRLDREILPLTRDSKHSSQSMHEIYKFFQDAADADVHLKLFKDEVNNTSILIRCENKFSLQDSLLFCVATISTIGYGNSSPKTHVGQMICVAYGVVGIPIMLFFIYYWSRFIQMLDVAILRPVLLKKSSRAAHMVKLVLFLLLWFALPTFIFSKIERWTILEGIYYCFVSLTTIGFGDYVPQRIKREDSIFEVQRGVLRISIDAILKWGYYVYIITWILSGLVVMSIFVERTAKRMHQTARAVERADCKPRTNGCDVGTDSSVAYEWMIDARPQHLNTGVPAVGRYESDEPDEAILIEPSSLSIET